MTAHPTRVSGPPLRGWVPGLVLAVSLLVTLGFAEFVAATTRAREHLRFLNLVRQTENAIQVRLEAYVATLRATAAFFGGRQEVSRRDFHRFVDRLELERFYPGIMGIGFSLRIPPGREDSVVAALRRQGVPQFRLWPAAPAGERHAIVYLEPLDRRNRAALGYDMYSDSVRREAMARARNRAAPAASGRVTLVQEIDQDRQAGFLIYVPLYRGGQIPATRAGRRDSLIGFVYSPFRADDLFRGIFGERTPRVNFRLYDSAALAGERLLHDSRRFAPGREEGDRPPRFTATTTLGVAGRTWGLVFSTGPEFERTSLYALEPLVLVGGILVSTVLFGLTRAQVRAQADTARIAEELLRSREAERESERRFRTLVEQSPLSTQVLAPDGRTLLVNRAWERLWGGTTEHLVDYNLLQDPQLEQLGLMPLIRRAFAGEAVALPPVAYRPDRGSRSGEEIWVRAFAYPVRDEAGRIREVVLVHDDITEDRRAEEAVLRAQKLESLGVLAGGIAHDFNNLLTGILGNASLARQALPAEHPVRPLLEDAIQASQRAAELTAQLLAYAGKGRFNVQLVDVCALVRELTMLLRSSIPKKVRLKLELPDGCGQVEADPSRLQQLVMNLVINGAEAIGEASGEVRIVARRRELDAAGAEAFAGFELSPGPYLELSVRDTGVGMDEATRARIFDPFFTTKFTGRGLGLAAAQGILRSHRGAIAVESAPGLGSTFTVVLPIVVRSATPPAPAAEPPRAASTAPDRGIILVVEDEELIRRAARGALEGEGYTVVEAADGQQALERLRSLPVEPRLVLLDLTMPVLSGEEAARRIREVCPRVPIVVTSGYGEAEAASRLAGAAVAAFLAKPYAAEQVAALVGRLLDGSIPDG